MCIAGAAFVNTAAALEVKYSWLDVQFTGIKIYEK